ncbi:hypothetical protein [Phaeacidiphilus oryzae]|jgi:hypothetical protein|uniref:hypothetical protein n=1 Tax=Phaeacidiphilus oryzae TaxID=348818 RepID=UPI000561B5D9|nr:hypothetical protein [Phaeacidiphilus oryzae]
MNTATALARTLAVASTPPPYNPGAAGGDELLGYLLWCASAAGVAGVIVVGTLLAVQLHRGEPGEGGGYLRQLIIVLGACVLAASAAPIVNFLGPLTL